MGELKRERKALFASPRSVICAHSYSATLVRVKKKKMGKGRGREWGGNKSSPLDSISGGFQSTHNV